MLGVSPTDDGRLKIGKTMLFLTYVTFATLLIIALLHVIWGLGILWPLKDEKSLVNAIAGFQAVEKMPPATASFFVAFIVLVAAAISLDLGRKVLIFPPKIALIGGAGVAIVFLSRGLLGYTRFWTKLTPEEPFRSLDSVLYSPLCLALGVSFSALAWSFGT